MKPVIKRLLTWRKILLTVLLLLVILPVVLLVQVSAKQSVILDTGSLDVSSSKQARALAVRLKDKVLSSSTLEEFSATEDEFNGIIKLAMRGFSRVAGRINVTPIGIEVAFALHVPENPFGDYVNVRAGLLPSDDGLLFAHSSIGSIRFSGETTLTLARLFLDLLLADDQGTELINAVKSVTMKGREVSVSFKPIPDLEQRLSRTRDRFKAVRDDLALLGDPEVVKSYYRKLCDFDKLHVGDSKVSLGWYLSAIFELAKQRVETGADVVDENRAAILALGIYLGNARIQALVGTVITDELENCNNNPHYVVLANRRDLRLHFVISAVLKVISDSGMSGAAGEFKELLDAGGGSGFSFADLAADMAGVKLAERLLDKDGYAWKTQTFLAASSEENVFFPSIDQLPENLPKQQFEFEYGSLKDPRYLAMVSKIDERLASLPVYQIK